MEPVVGTQDDYLVEVMTEIGQDIETNVLDALSINEHTLVKSASELPELVFFYNAALQRAMLRVQKVKLQLEEAEAQEHINLKEQYRARNVQIGVEEIKSRITLDPNIKRLRTMLDELTVKRDTIKAVCDALTRKGFSLQLVGQIRMREEDWLRQSLTERLRSHVNGPQIVKLMEQILHQQ